MRIIHKGQAMTDDAKELLLRKYASYVMQYNRVFGLTRAESAEEFYENHIRDALLAVTCFAPYANEQIHDIGSGVGVPGIPLSIFFDSTSFVLVERSAKRAAFLRNAVVHLGLQDRVSVENRELSSYRNIIKVATFRALAGFDDIVKSLFDSLVPSATVLMYKGRRSEFEKEDYSFFSSFEVVHLDGGCKERNMVILKK